MAQDQPLRRRHTFPQGFRLKRKRLIRPLFDRGRKDVGTATAGCIRLLYRLADPVDAGVAVPLQIGFTTGRGVKRAVDRNRLKRYMRESFRLNQHLLLDLMASRPDKMLTVMVIFRGNLETAGQQIPRAIPTAFSSLAVKIQEGSMP
ncbi:MAG: ribonuclease P protein component [Rhodothermales bacterium]